MSTDLAVLSGFRHLGNSLRSRLHRRCRLVGPAVRSVAARQESAGPQNARRQWRSIEHRTTGVGTPHVNGFVERLNRTLFDECFRVNGRRACYIGAKEIQRDLDRFMRYYNLERSHQGYALKGRTLAQALMEALAVTEIFEIVPPGGRPAAANGRVNRIPADPGAITEMK